MIRWKSSRLKREATTIDKMINLYCRRHHQQELCHECKTLKTYAVNRLNRCPFKETKPVCAKCKIHCYDSEMQLKIRKVMGYTGPRMMLRHPILAMAHLVDGILINVHSDKRVSNKEV